MDPAPSLEEARRAAHAAEQRFRALVDGIGAIVWEARAVAADGVEFSFVSGRAEVLLGHPVARFLADPGFWLELIHPDDRAGVLERGREALAAGRDLDHEYRVIAADGRTVWLRDIVNVSRDGAGVVLAGLSVEVTERRVAQERMRRLQEVTKALTTLLEPAEVARVVVEQGAPAAGAASAVVYLCVEDRMSELAAWGDTAGATEANSLTLALTAEDSVLGKLVVSRATGTGFELADRTLLDVLALACTQALSRARSVASERAARLLVDTIVDTAPEGFALFDLDLRYIRVNDSMAAINGLGADEHVGRQVAEVIPGISAEGVLEPLRQVLETGEPVDVEATGRTAGDPDQDHTWLVSYYPVRDEHAELVGIGAFVVDITERKRAQRRAELLVALSAVLDRSTGVEQRLEGVTRLLLGRICDACSIALFDADGKLECAASAHSDPEREGALSRLARIDEGRLGRPATQPLELTDDLLERLSPDPDDLELRRAVGTRSVIVVGLAAGSRRIGQLELGSSRPRAFAGHDVELAGEIGRRITAAIESERLHESERSARERTTRLQAVTEALSEALTPHDVAGAILGHVLGAVGATGGTVYQLDGDGDGEAAVVVGQHGHRPRAVDDHRRIGLDQRMPVTDVIRTGLPRWLHDIDEKVSAYPALTEDFRRPGPGALAVLPLSVPGRAVGAVTLSFATARAFGGEERAFLLGIASQCGQALDRARLYEAQRRVAATLQRSLLPARIPTLDGVDVAVRYLPAAGLDAGGDFYEVIRLPGGAIGLAVGDVVGRGAPAAAVMGQLRAALRAFAMGGDPPGEVLRRLSAFAETVEGALAATAVYAVLDPGAGILRYACAGHPWPLLVEPGGASRFLQEGRTVPLGCSPDPGADEGTVALVPGATVLLFTDGLTDRRGVDGEAALEALRAAAVGECGNDLAGLLDAVVSVAGGDDLLDDVALLAVRPAVPVYHFRFDADPRNVREARTALRSWLAATAVDDETSADVLLAAGEAVANAVEHAYFEAEPGMVELTFERDRHTGIVLVVRDFGSWRRPGASIERGRGLGLIRAVMDEVDVDVSAQGTTVRMHRPIGDPAATAQASHTGEPGT